MKLCDTCDEKVFGEKLEHCKYLRHELLNMPSESTQEKQSEEENTSEKIYTFLKTKIKKIIVAENDSSQVFAIIQNNDHCETLDLSSKKASQWARYSYFKQNKKNHGEDAYVSALHLIKAEAVYEDANAEPIFNRIAMVNNTLYYDLSTPDWKAVKITKDSVEIVSIEPKIPVFCKTQSQKEQIMPVFGQNDSMQKLAILLRIPIKDRQTFLVHLISMFLEKFPIPIMSIIGEHGSIKSTISKAVKQIVDPSGSKTISLSDPANLVLSFHNRYCICFDNVSKINQETSDILCKAVTGDGNAKRKLYTDSDEIIYSYKRKIILNGISPNLEFPDLVDRNITYITEKISEQERITEEDFLKEFNMLMPHVLGLIFQTLSKAMEVYDSVKSQMKQLPRMADFTIWGECISISLGYEPMSFTNSYKDRIESHSLDIVEAYPIISIVEEMLKDKESYEDTVQFFYNAAKVRAESNGIDIKSRHVNFPRAPNKIKEHVTRLKQNFRSIGFEVDIAQYTKRDGRHPRNRQIIYITRIKNTIAQFDESQCLPHLPSLPKNILENIGNINNVGRDGKHGRDTLGTYGDEEFFENPSQNSSEKVQGGAK